MADLATLRELYDHMRWADAIVWRAALATPNATTDPFLRERLWHIHTVQRAFLSVWRQQSPDFRELSTFPDLATIARWGRDYYDEVRPYLDSVAEDALENLMIMPWAGRLTKRFGREPAPTTLRETMLQLPMHSTYHRGQVNARLRDLGGEPPLVDYIAWIWQGKPPAEWPEER